MENRDDDKYSDLHRLYGQVRPRWCPGPVTTFPELFSGNGRTDFTHNIRMPMRSGIGLLFRLELAFIMQSQFNRHTLDGARDMEIAAAVAERVASLFPNPDITD